MTTRPAARSLTVAAILVASWSLLACSPPRTDSASTHTSTATETTAPQRQTTPSEPTCGTPTLHVNSPRNGDRVTAPFPITYETECFSLNNGTIYFTADRIRMDLHPKTSSGTVTVPDQPLLSGRRTVTIQLTDKQGHPLDNPDATILMTIIIEGSRGAR